MLKFSSCLLALISCSSSAFAIRSCDEFPSCEKLGYSKSEVANCKEYIHCPFDTDYKVCVKTEDTKQEETPLEDCDTTVYTLSACPKNVDCEECTDTNGSHFKYLNCKDGYHEQCVTKDSCETVIETALKNGPCTKCKTGYTYDSEMQPYTIFSIPTTYYSTNKACQEDNPPSDGMTLTMCLPSSKTAAGCKPQCSEDKTCDNEFNQKKCPDLATCDQCTETKCNETGTLYKITGCVANAEQSNGTCECKPGYYKDKNTCASCADKKQKLMNEYYCGNTPKKMIVTYVTGSIKECYLTAAQYSSKMSTCCNSLKTDRIDNSQCTPQTRCQCQTTCNKINSELEEFNNKCNGNLKIDCYCNAYLARSGDSNTTTCSGPNMSSPNDACD